MKKMMLSAIVLCLFSTLKAQDEGFALKEQNPTLAVAIVPQSFAYNSAELNLDVRVTDRQWLTIAPIFQFSDKNSYFYDARDAIKSGFGLGFNYRYFPLTRYSRRLSDGKGPFIAAGLRGQTTTYEYTGNLYVPYTDGYDNTGLVPSETPYKDRVSQIGFDVNIGYVLRMFDILFVEGYMGIGTRYSNYEYDATKGLNLGASRWDTGFTGYCFTGGLRFGIFLNRYTRK